jgi:thiol-disulfide isomerase/thioredoxin
MHRREVLAGLGSLAAVGGGAAIAFDSFDSTSTGVDPVDLEALDAQGSQAGTLTVPERGRVTFVEVFATWCTVCKSMMPRLAEVHASVGETVQFLSVTNEPLGNTVTRQDIADWWREHGGNWTVAADTDLELTTRLDASGVPYAFVLNERNTVVWAHRGRASVDTLQSQIRDHR